MRANIPTLLRSLALLLPVLAASEAEAQRTPLSKLTPVRFENGSPSRNGYAMNIWTNVASVYVICGEAVYLTYVLQPMSRGFAGNTYWYDGEEYAAGAPVYAPSVHFRGTVLYRNRSVRVDNADTSVEQELGSCSGPQVLRLWSLSEVFGDRWDEQDLWGAVNSPDIWQVGTTPPLRNWDLELQIAARLGKDLEEERQRQRREQLAEQVARDRARRAAEQAAAAENERRRLQEELLEARQQREQQARDETRNGRLEGRITHAVTRAGISGASVLITGGSTSVTLVSRDEGEYQTPLLSPGTYTVLVEADGFQPAVLYDAEVSLQEVGSIPSIPLVPASDQPGTISGVVRNARNATAMASVAVELRSGIGARNGPVVARTTTGGNGQYRFTGLQAGTYSVAASSGDYVDGLITGISVGGSEVSNQDVLLSPVGTENEIRIVLGWGANPNDLDSHLFGPDGSGGRFRISYSGRGSIGSAPFAALDVDDTDSYGPETITIATQSPGVYRYAVHHFAGSGSLSRSGAVVQVFRGSTLLGRFEPPGGANGVGDVWVVFELEGRSLRPVNTIGRTFPD